MLDKSNTNKRIARLAKGAMTGLAVVSLCFMAGVGAQGQMGGQTAVKKSGKGTPLTTNGRTMVAEFSATWCGPCKRFAPTYEKISHDFADKADFTSVDVDAQSDVADYYHVDSVPTVVILDASGKTKWRHSGILTEKQLTDRITKAVSGK